MNRTLKRPMFRMGGAAEGITSGLDKPRQQYNQGRMVKNQFEADRLAQNAAKMKDAAMSVFLKGAEARGQFNNNTLNNTLLLAQVLEQASLCLNKPQDLNSPLPIHNSPSSAMLGGIKAENQSGTAI